MLRQSIRLITLLVVAFMACSSASAVNMKVDYNTIPKPYSLELTRQGVYELDNTSYITYPERQPDLEVYAVMLQDYIEQMTGIFVETGYTDATEAEERSIYLHLDDSLPQEEFRLNVTPQSISLTSGGQSGLAYGVQYLRKILAPMATFTSSKGISHYDDIDNASYSKVGSTLSLDFPTADVVYRSNMETRNVMLDKRFMHLSNREFETIVDIISLHGFNRLVTNQELTDKQIRYAKVNGVEISKDYESILYSAMANIGNATDLEETVFGIVGSTSLDQLFDHIRVASTYAVTYDDDFQKVVAQLLPGLAILSEHQWTHSMEFNRVEMLQRLETLCQLYTHYKYPFSEDVYMINTSPRIDYEAKKVMLSMSTLDKTPVFWSVNGSDAMLVLGEVELKSSCELVATSTRKVLGNREYTTQVDFNKATLQKVDCSKDYLFGDTSEEKLVNLVNALKSSSEFPMNEWVYLLGNDITIDITLDKVQKVSTVGINHRIDKTLNCSEIKDIKILLSTDGKSFNEVYSSDKPYPDTPTGDCQLLCKFKSQKAKMVRIVVNPSSEDTMPLIAIDEISVN
ncbi:MAG: hypothetical protein II308_05550 [Muribaculaceae bacterium]|nr:hypothetical protein [Muribaculaceae bacterium]